jgi:hypothetical protein
MKGLGLRDQGLGRKIQGLEFRALGSRYNLGFWNFGFTVKGS